MGSCNSEITHDVPPYLRVYKDGTVDRLVATEVTPATFDLKTGVSSKDTTVIPETGVSARLYRPNLINKAQRLPLVIYFHGGAFCVASASEPKYHNSLNQLVAEAKIIAVSVDYRLVPEHPLPVVYEDSWAVLQWVASHNSGEGSEDWLRESVDFSKVFLAGDSAGANISHHIAIRAGYADPRRGLQLRGIVMIHPYFWGEEPIGIEVKDPVRKGMVDKWWQFVCPSDKGCGVNGSGDATGAKEVVVSAAEEGQYCKIIYIPNKPPVPPHLQPTVNVHAAVIEPKYANTLVRKLNQIAPLENLRHVKRVRRKKAQDGGKSKLSVILCLVSESDSELDGVPNDVLELIKQYQLSTFVAKVCKYAALTKEEWDEQCKLWPTSYHPPTYNIPGITGFSEEDTKSVFCFMKYAVDVAKSSTDLVVNAAVIVDPSTKQVISSACDQDLSGTAPKSKTYTEKNCFKHPEAHTLTKTSEMENHRTLFPCHVSNFKRLCISCLHPWGWTEQQLPTSSFAWHPLRHAAMVAIEHSAARDRLLYPNSGHSAAEMIDEGYMVPGSTGLPSKRQKVNLTQGGVEENLDLESNIMHSDPARPYLCTGYDIYLVWEPCIMCAMALVHQRVKRIFYALPNPNAGALGSILRLQGERSLNHHYAVFRVLVPEEILRDETLSSSNSENGQIEK